MNCVKCGALIEEGVLFCPECGEPVKREEVTEPVAESVIEPDVNVIEGTNTDVAVESSEEAVTVPAPSNKKKKLALIIGAVIAALVVFFTIIAIVVTVIVVKQVGKANLKEELLRDWSRAETGTGGTYYTLELDFTEDEIIYNFDSLYIDSEISRFDYEVISKDKIKINDSTVHEIEFNDEKTMMTVTPAISSADYSENWFHFSEY